MSFFKEHALLLACVGGIYFFYMLYGVYQERLTRQPYGLEKEYFSYIVFSLLIQTCVNGVIAFVVCLVTNCNFRSLPPKAVFGPALTCLLAMCFSNEALKYINFPSQILGKTLKPIPVMIVGRIYNKKQYPWWKYALVLLIVMGISLFFIFQTKTKHSSEKVITAADWTYGLVLLGLSLAMDGATGPVQDHLFAHFKPTSSLLMLWTNIWSALFLLPVVFFTGQLEAGVGFCLRNPEAVKDMIILSVCSAFGQNMIFLTIQHFSSLTMSLATTTRKFFTVLTSVFLYGHAIAPAQWLGIILVFGGLICDGFLSKKTKVQKKKSS
eukprot:GCRY01003458.1.p1 GENE.GCRY01003458.1~~GCRY01003458.1.p1  ORF type:complete len:324 (+),score=33.98 GCRY01003458.1:129-1100(+)